MDKYFLHTINEFSYTWTYLYVRYVRINAERGGETREVVT